MQGDADGLLASYARGGADLRDYDVFMDTIIKATDARDITKK